MPLFLLLLSFNSVVFTLREDHHGRCVLDICTRWHCAVTRWTIPLIKIYSLLVTTHHRRINDKISVVSQVKFAESCCLYIFKNLFFCIVHPLAYGGGGHCAMATPLRP